MIELFRMSFCFCFRICLLNLILYFPPAGSLSMELGSLTKESGSGFGEPGSGFGEPGSGFGEPGSCFECVCSGESVS